MVCAKFECIAPARTLTAKIAAVSALRIVGPNEVGIAISSSAFSSSGVKSPSGPMKTLLAPHLRAFVLKKAFASGSGGGFVSAPTKQVVSRTSASASLKSTA